MTRANISRSFLIVGAFVCATPNGQSAVAEESPLNGQKVTVVRWETAFLFDGKQVSKAYIGDCFVVSRVEGDLLWIQSQSAFLNRSDVVPYGEVIDYFTNKIKAHATALNYTCRGVCWKERGDIDSAVDDFDAAIRLDPGFPAAYYNRGIALLDEHEFEDAFADFDKVIRLTPEYADAYVGRGLAWCKRHNIEKGVIDLNRAILLDPNNSDAFRNRGRARMDEGNYYKAIPDFSYAIEIDPNYSATYVHRATAYELLGEYDKAFANYEALVRVDPALGLRLHAWALATLPDSKYRDGKKAYRYATKSCELTDWKNPWAIADLSAALAELGEFNEAIKRLEQAIAISSDVQKGLFDDMMNSFKAGKAYRDEPNW